MKISLYLISGMIVSKFLNIFCVNLFVGLSKYPKKKIAIFKTIIKQFGMIKKIIEEFQITLKFSYLVIIIIKEKYISVK